FSLLLHLLPRPPRPTPFPYTTLFRSPFEQPAVAALGRIDLEQQAAARRIDVVARAAAVVEDHAIDRERPRRMVTEVVGVLGRQRSEEHTSELQSRENLVCRLLLEKKK